MNNATKTAALVAAIACFAIQNIYSMNRETGREFAQDAAMKLANKAYQKAQELNATAMPSSTTVGKILEYVRKHEQEIKQLAKGAISMAKTEMQNSRSQAVQQEAQAAINKAKEAIDLITVSTSVND